MAVSNYKVLKNIYSNLSKFSERYILNCGYYPLDVEIRVGWKCNAKCKMCGLHSYILKKDYMSREELSEEKIVLLLKQLHELKCTSVTFSGGEPTLNEGLGRIIEYAANRCGMVTSINTNGYLLNEERIREYIDSGVDSFTISILSPENEINDSIMGLKNGLSITENAIDYINQYSKRKNKNIKIYINNVLLKENIASIHKYSEFCRNHRISHLNLSPASISTEWDEWTADDEELRPTKMQIKYLKENVIPKLQMKDCNIFVEDPFGDTDEEIEKNLHVIFSNVPNECFIPMIHTVIQYNGDVIPCCYAPDYFIMGNVLKETFKDIWEGAKYSKFRSECKLNMWDMCRSCRQYNKLNSNIYEKLNYNVE